MPRDDGGHAQDWHEGFEGDRPSWGDAGGNAPYRLVRHERFHGSAHTGQGCEWLQVEAGAGVRVYFAHEVGCPRIIEELAPSVWIKADRAGPWLAIRVVLPRTVDPRSGRPIRTILEGPAYTDAGRWQQLRLVGIPAMLDRQVRMLRMQFGPDIDGREAYVDAVLLGVHGGPDLVNVWIDDLDVAGHVGSTSGTDPTFASTKTGLSPVSQHTAASPLSSSLPLAPVRLPTVQRRDPIANSVVPLPSTGQGSSPRRCVRLSNAVLAVNDVPMFPRIIQHRGEPLAALKRLGFNAVWLQRVPTSDTLEEADRLGLWLVCPPPREVTSADEIGPAFDSVLAWSLGVDLGEGDLDATRRSADHVRAADRRLNRPLICGPHADLRGYSRSADLLLIDRRPLSSSLELSEFATWVRRQPLLAMAGRPVWTAVQTQPNAALRQQLIALDPDSAAPLSVSPEQVRLLAYTAVISGSRGLLFLSDTPLDAPDAQTRQRAETLELLNLELALIEPWAAQGSYVGTAESSALT